MSESLQRLLSTLFGRWREVADDTIGCLGEEKASLFIELFNDALEIYGAIRNAYPEEKEAVSMSFITFEVPGLWKELYWFQALFLAGNYRLIVSQLRFNWERIFRVRYADAYNEENLGASDGPGPTLDDKCDWLTRREDRLTWKTLILPTLKRLFPANAPAAIESQFKPLWDRLNHCVHPSGELRDKLVSDSALHTFDAFDETWAQETLDDAAAVFAIIWLAILSRFPAAVSILLTKPSTFRTCPQLRAALEARERTY